MDCDWDVLVRSLSFADLTCNANLLSLTDDNRGKGTYREGPRVRFLHDEEHELALGGCRVDSGVYMDL